MNLLLIFLAVAVSLNVQSNYGWQDILSGHFSNLIISAGWEDTFSEIVSKLEKFPEEAVVEKILISKSEKIIDPVHIVSLHGHSCYCL